MAIGFLSPSVRLSLRQTFNQLRWAPLLPLLILEGDLPAAGRLERISTFLLCCAAPQIVGYLLEMEHSGRLDQMRLAGRTPGLVAWRLTVGAGGPWIAAGSILLAWSAAAEERLNHPMVTVALIGAPTAIAALFTTRLFAKERIDPRILIAGLALVGASFGIIGQLQFWSMGGNIARTATLFAIGEAAIIAACLRGFMRRIAYPPASAAKTGTAIHYRPAFLMGAPAVYRGAVLAASGYVLAVIFTPLIAIVRGIVREPDVISITPLLLLPPLVIGAIVISLICREDAVSGRLDIVRQSAMTASTTALQMIAGLWLPFVAASVVLTLIASTMFTLNPLELGLAVAVFLAVAPLPVVEGWSRIWVLMFALPYLVAMLMHARSGAWVSAVVLIAVLWLAAVRRMRDSEAVVLGRWPAAVVAAVLGAWPWLTITEMAFRMVALGAGLLAVSPLLVPARFSRRRDTWIPLAAIAAAAMAAASSTGFSGVAAGATSGFMWLTAVRVHQSSGLAPIAQGMIRAGCIIFTGVFIEIEANTQLNAFGSWRMAAFALFLFVVIDAGLRAKALAGRLVTPRA